jgi:hypothetical protein
MHKYSLGMSGEGERKNNPFKGGKKEIYLYYIEDNNLVKG